MRSASRDRAICVINHNVGLLSTLWGGGGGGEHADSIHSIPMYNTCCWLAKYPLFIFDFEWLSATSQSLLCVGSYRGTIVQV